LSCGAEDGAADYAEIMIRRAIATTCWPASARTTGRSFVSAEVETAWILRSDQECCNADWWAYEGIDPPGFASRRFFKSRLQFAVGAVC